MTRLPITKTPKPYVGGAFIRSESGRTFPLKDTAGNFFANIPQCTRKDLRNAVEAAAKAGPGWAKRTAYNRGQILYRLGEMLEARRQEMIDVHVQLGGPKGPATKAVDTAVDRLIYYAGWADKYEQVLGNVNPVASPHFNFTVTEPMGVVGIIAPDLPPLLPLISLIAPAIVSGNTVVALASTAQPYPAIVLGEMLATSDLPGGVVNILTGRLPEMAPWLAGHMDVNAIDLTGAADPGTAADLERAAADNLKRVFRRPAGPVDWTADPGLRRMLAFLETKTVWHPKGV